MIIKEKLLYYFHLISKINLKLLIPSSISFILFISNSPFSLIKYINSLELPPTPK